MTFGRPASLPGHYVNADEPLPFTLDQASGNTSPTVEQVNSNNVPFFAASL
jgi:hypothetical protein